MAMSQASNPNIFLFTGENAYLLEKTLEKLRGDFEKKHGDLNITVLEDEQELTARSIIGAIEAAPFLGEKRLVIIRNFFRLGDSDEQDKVETYLEKIPETSLVIFYEHPHVETKKRPKSSLKKTVGKIGNVKEFAIPSPQELISWIQSRLQKSNVTITATLAQEMINDCGTDMQQLAQEIQKLSLFCENREVTKHDLDVMIPKSYSATIFQFTDALNAKNAQMAIEKLQTLVEMGEEILIILSMIARHFRMLILVKDLLENQKIPKAQIYNKMTSYDPNMKPYPVKIAVDQSVKFSIEQLKTIYQTLVEINLNLRTGRIPQGPNDKHMMMLELEKFIMKVTA